MSVDPQVARQLDEKAARDAVWIALHLAHRLGWSSVTGQLTSMLLHVDALRAASDEGALFRATVAETFGEEIAQRVQS